VILTEAQDLDHVSGIDYKLFNAPQAADSLFRSRTAFQGPDEPLADDISRKQSTTGRRPHYSGCNLDFIISGHICGPEKAACGLFVPPAKTKAAGELPFSKSRFSCYRVAAKVVTNRESPRRNSRIKPRKNGLDLLPGT